MPAKSKGEPLPANHPGRGPLALAPGRVPGLAGAVPILDKEGITAQQGETSPLNDDQRRSCLRGEVVKVLKQLALDTDDPEARVAFINKAESVESSGRILKVMLQGNDILGFVRYKSNCPFDPVSLSLQRTAIVKKIQALIGKRDWYHMTLGLGHCGPKGLAQGVRDIKSAIKKFFRSRHIDRLFETGFAAIERTTPEDAQGREISGHHYVHAHIILVPREGVVHRVKFERLPGQRPKPRIQFLAYPVLDSEGKETHFNLVYDRIYRPEIDKRTGEIVRDESGGIPVLEGEKQLTLQALFYRSTLKRSFIVGMRYQADNPSEALKYPVKMDEDRASVWSGLYEALQLKVRWRWFFGDWFNAEVPETKESLVDKDGNEIEKPKAAELMDWRDFSRMDERNFVIACDEILTKGVRIMNAWTHCEFRSLAGFWENKEKGTKDYRISTIILGPKEEMVEMIVSEKVLNGKKPEDYIGRKCFAQVVAFAGKNGLGLRLFQDPFDNPCEVVAG